jgi:hypothetical protein
VSQVPNTKLKIDGHITCNWNNIHHTAVNGQTCGDAYTEPVDESVVEGCDRAGAVEQRRTALLAAGCVAIGVSSQPIHYAPWAEVVMLILPFVFPPSHVMFPFDTQSPSDMLASHALYPDPSVAGDLACQSHLKRAYSYDKDYVRWAGIFDGSKAQVTKRRVLIDCVVANYGGDTEIALICCKAVSKESA